MTVATAATHAPAPNTHRGEDATLDISRAKVFATTMSQLAACMQLGGAGYCWENPAARAFVDSRLAIGGGADEVMKQVVAKMLGI